MRALRYIVRSSESAVSSERRDNWMRSKKAEDYCWTIFNWFLAHQYQLVIHKSFVKRACCVWWRFGRTRTIAFRQFCSRRVAFRQFSSWHVAFFALVLVVVFRHNGPFRTRSDADVVVHSLLFSSHTQCPGYPNSWAWTFLLFDYSYLLRIENSNGLTIEGFSKTVSLASQSTMNIGVWVKALRPRLLERTGVATNVLSYCTGSNILTVSSRTLRRWARDFLFTSFVPIWLCIYLYDFARPDFDFIMFDCICLLLGNLYIF